MYKHMHSVNAMPRSIQGMSCDHFSSAIQARIGCLNIDVFMVDHSVRSRLRCNVEMRKGRRVIRSQ